MPSFRDLATLAAFDPMPTQLGPVKRPFDPSKPLFDAAALAAHDFERTPHELHPRQLGSAGSLAGHDFDLCWFDESTAFRAAARSQEFLRSVLSHGDQRDPGEGQRGHSDEGRPQAGNCPDPGNAGSGFIGADLDEIEARVIAYQQEQASKTRWTSAARSALNEAQFAEFKDRLKWLGMLEVDRPLNVYRWQCKTIDCVQSLAVRWYLHHAFYNDEHLLA